MAGGLPGIASKNLWKKHGTEAAGDDVEGAVGKWKRVRGGFLEFDIAEILLRGEFSSEGHHAHADVGGNDAAAWADKACDAEGGIADTTGEIENVLALLEIGFGKNSVGCAASEFCNLFVPFAPGGDSVITSPIGFKLPAELFEFFERGIWHGGIVTHVCEEERRCREGTYWTKRYRC